MYCNSKSKRKTHWQQKFNQYFYPPVNVDEKDEVYQISIFAAGYQKNDFDIQIEDDYLIVKAETKENDELKHHHILNGFERYFKLNPKINREAIAASYKNGVLEITLQKNERDVSKKTSIEIK